MKTKLFSLLAVICLAALITGALNVQAAPVLPGSTRVLADSAMAPPVTLLPVASGTFSETITAQAPAKNGTVNQATGPAAGQGSRLYNARVIGETDPDSPHEAVYIVQLADQPLATYRGDLANLPATSLAVTNEPKLNVQAPASVLYRSYLDDKQAQFLQSAEQSLSQPLEVVYRYDVVFNGLAVKATPAEATRLLKLPGVVSVQRDYWRYPATDSSVEFLGVDDVWSGGGGLPGTRGDGIIVGIIDSGIWPEHPSFADNGAYPPPPAKWKGTCQAPADDSPGYLCNNKLIGIQYFLSGYVASLGGEYDGLFHSGRDDNGHGTHTASTTAGNENVSAFIYGIPRGQVSGMAPRAYIASYKGLGPGGGTGSDLTAAIDKAVADGVDVINYSVGSDTASDPWVDSDALAYLNARAAGVFVATSAGNDGPGVSTVGSPANAPWVTTVGASYFNRLFLSSITVTVGTGVVTTSHVYSGATTTPGVTNFDLVDTRGITDTSGKTDGSCDAAFPAGTFDWNDAVLCDRGGGIFTPIHGNLIQQSGGGAAILYNAENHYDFNSYLHPIPTVVILRSTWLSIQSLIDNNPGASFKVSFSQGNPVDSYVPPDTVVGFSSRGPNINETTSELINVLKPDVTAPGIHILAGASPEYVEVYGSGTGRYGMQNQLFQVIQGTSMSSPHVAGLGALLKALHPDWSPAEIQSALMLTGLTSNQYEREAGGDSAADPFDIGNGRVLVANAAQAGFVLDETIDNYLAVDPYFGGDPATLNLPSLTQADCMGTCTWVRTISSTLGASVTWNAAQTPAGLDLTVEPASFQLAAGATQVVTVTANVGALGFNNWGFDEIRFTGSGQALHFTVAARSVPGLAPRAVEIETRRNQGIYLVEDLRSAVSGNLAVTTYSGTPTGLSGTVAPDPTNGDPYDDLAQVYATLVTVPAGAKGLEVSIVDSTAPDLDMFVGRDTNGNGSPDASEELCSSTSGSYEEYCSLPESGSLAAGNYWILVQNWAGSGAATDTFTLEYAVLLADGGSGPIQVSAPATVTAGAPYDLTLSWNLPGLQAGEVRRQVIGLAADGTELNEVGVTLVRLDDDVTKMAQVPSGQVIEPGDTVAYAITINPDPVALDYNNGVATYILTDTLPAGMTYVPGSASIAPASVNGNQIVWEIPVETERRYVMSTNRQDAACDTGFGGYVNLAAFGIKPRSSLSGDNIVSHVDEFYGGSVPFNFFDADYSKLYFTDNGYLVPADAAPANTGANVTIPNPAAPNNLAAGLWRDFEVVYDATNNYGITIAGAGGGALMVVEYDNIYPKGGTIANSLDMNVVFQRQPSDTAGDYEVVFAYDNVNLPDQAGTIGLENADGSAGVAYAFNNVQNLEDLVICFDWTNATQITFAAQVDASLNTSTLLTNPLLHAVNGGGVGQAQTTIIVTAVRLEIGADGPQTVTSGALTYTLTITNNGVGPATGTLVKALLPAGTGYGSGGNFDPVTQEVSWNLAQIPAHGSASVQLVANTSPLTLSKTSPVSTGITAAGVTVQIIGGGPAPITDWPWQVALLDTTMLPDVYDAQMCGGALLAPDWVLTAAHCTLDDWGDPRSLVVLAGTAVLTPTQGIQVDVAQMVVHELYTPGEVQSSYDIALLRLAEPLPLSDAIATIHVATPADAGYYAPNQLAATAGWGRISAIPAVYTRQLQRVTLAVQTNADCSAYLTETLGAETPITDHMLCAGFPEGGKGSCYGDSGGALVVPNGQGGWLAAGVTSWGAQACDAPSTVYTRVSQFVEWIERAMNRYSFHTYSASTGAGLPGDFVEGGQEVVTEFVFPKELQQETIWPNQVVDRRFTHPASGLTVDVAVPAGLVTSSNGVFQLVYSPLAGPSYPLVGTQAATNTFTFAGHAFNLVATREGRPLDGYTFSLPLTLRLTYGPTADESSLGLYRWNGSAWSQEGINLVSLDAVANQLTVTLTRPGQLALLQGGAGTLYLPVITKN